jgi:hypothetical protein
MELHGARRALPDEEDGATGVEVHGHDEAGGIDRTVRVGQVVTERGVGVDRAVGTQDPDVQPIHEPIVHDDDALDRTVDDEVDAEPVGTTSRPARPLVRPQVGPTPTRRRLRVLSTS